MWHKDSYWGLRKIRKHRPRVLDRKGRRIRFRKGLEIDKKYQWIGFVGKYLHRKPWFLPWNCLGFPGFPVKIFPSNSMILTWYRWYGIYILVMWDGLVVWVWMGPLKDGAANIKAHPCLTFFWGRLWTYDESNLKGMTILLRYSRIPQVHIDLHRYGLAAMVFRKKITVY